MKVIGHRGAAGLALENTIESIQAAVQAGVDAIEFDIRITKDGEIVLSHDKHVGRVSDASHYIHEHTLAKLRQTPLQNGQRLATLDEAIRAADGTPLVIEGKDSGWARPLANFLNKQAALPGLRVISFNHRELYTFSLLQPEVAVYALENTKPLEVIRVARVFGFAGIDINFWLLNPLTYLLARYHKLDILVYTINKPWMARFVGVLYPNINITTDVPNQLQFLRKKKRVKS